MTKKNDIIEKRYNPNHGADGKFTSGGSAHSEGKTKYAPSPRRNPNGITVNPKKYASLCGILGTLYPNAKAGDRVTINDANHSYDVTADGFGGMTINSKTSIKRKRR